ncbi:MAG: hypothetical protein ACK559_12520, partial [bacterium]
VGGERAAHGDPLEGELDRVDIFAVGGQGRDVDERAHPLLGLRFGEAVEGVEGRHPDRGEEGVEAHEPGLLRGGEGLLELLGAGGRGVEALEALQQLRIDGAAEVVGALRQAGEPQHPGQLHAGGGVDKGLQRGGLAWLGLGGGGAGGEDAQPVELPLLGEGLGLTGREGGEQQRGGEAGTEHRCPQGSGRGGGGRPMGHSMALKVQKKG